MSLGKCIINPILSESDGGLCGRAWRRLREARVGALVPRRRVRAALLVAVNVANWALAARGLIERPPPPKHLLAVLATNAVLHVVIYVAMKLLHRERLGARAWLFLFAAAAAWGLALYEYSQSRARWSEPAARSRERNAPCSIMRFDIIPLCM